MKLGNLRVEQVSKAGQVVMDYDQSLSSSEIFNHIVRTFPNIEERSSKIVYHGMINGIKYSIRIKNVTYLGIPHPIFKKRIQIAGDFQQFVADSRSSGYVPLLLGIYTYGENTLFCDFNIDDYIENTSNNSSAHVSVNDLREAVHFGYFEKTDMFGNHIKVFDENNVLNFLNSKLGISVAQNELLRMLQCVDEFMLSVNPNWLGTEAYQEMYDANYRHWRQCEWSGFYLEYLFDRFLDNNPAHRQVISRAHLRHGTDYVNLDVYYPGLDMYGDLKSHNTQGARGIIGNDRDTTDSVLLRSEDESIYYIVASGVAVRDLDQGSVTSRFYSNLKGSSNLSYASRMKYSFDICEYYIIDLNKGNYPHTCLFNQGKNSNGLPRPPKVMFPEDSLNNFIIHRMRIT